jgi:hypothetical protein
MDIFSGKTLINRTPWESPSVTRGRRGWSSIWFPSVLHARNEIETQSREYNEERPKRAIGRAHAQQLCEAAETVLGSYSFRY